MEASASIFSHKGSKMAVRRRHSSFLKGTELLNWFTKKQLYTQHFFTLVFHHFSLCKCFCLYFFKARASAPLSSNPNFSGSNPQFSLFHHVTLKITSLYLLFPVFKSSILTNFVIH